MKEISVQYLPDENAYPHDLYLSSRSIFQPHLRVEYRLHFPMNDLIKEWRDSVPLVGFYLILQSFLELYLPYVSLFSFV